MRSDDHDRFGSETTARFAASYRPSSAVTLRGSWGQGFKAPTIFQSTFFCCGATAANEVLRPERSEGIEAGIDWRADGGRAQASVTLFRQDTENLISFSFGVGGYENIAEVESEGVEVSARWVLHEYFELQADYAWIEATEGNGSPAAATAEALGRPAARLRSTRRVHKYPAGALQRQRIGRGRRRTRCLDPSGRQRPIRAVRSFRGVWTHREPVGCPLSADSRLRDARAVRLGGRAVAVLSRTPVASWCGGPVAPASPSSDATAGPGVWLLAAMAVALTGCSADSPEPPSSVHRPQRIVSLDFCADQYVLRFVERDRILALSPDAEREFSYMRDQAAGLPTVRPVAEDVIVLEPDLVVRAYGGGPQAAVMFQRAGVPVHNVPWAESIEAVTEVVLETARALGSADQGQAVAAEMQARLAALPSLAQDVEALYMTPAGVTSGPRFTGSTKSSWQPVLKTFKRGRAGGRSRWSDWPTNGRISLFRPSSTI